MPVYFLHRDILPYAPIPLFRKHPHQYWAGTGTTDEGLGEGAGEGEAMARAGLGRAPQGGPRAVQERQGESHGDM